MPFPKLHFLQKYYFNKNKKIDLFIQINNLQILYYNIGTYLPTKLYQVCKTSQLAYYYDKISTIVT